MLLVAGMSFLLMLRQEEPLRHVDVAVSRTPLSAPLYIADELGLFREEGLDVELVELIGGLRSFEHMINGAADFATTSDSVLMFQGFKRRDFVNVATFVQSDNDVKIITRRDAEIDSARDLIGRRAALIRGTASEYFLSAYLALEHIELDQLELLSAQPEEMPALLGDGHVDAVVVWEPYSYQTIQRLGERARVLPTRNLYTLTFNLVSRREYAAAQGDDVRRMLRAVERAIEFSAEEPAKARDIIRRRLVLEGEFIDWILRDYLFKLSLNRSLMLTLDNQASWALNSGLVQAEELPDFRSLVEPGPLRDVIPHAVTLNHSDGE